MLKFEFPDRGSRGYLRRQHKVEVQTASDEDDGQVFARMVEILLEFAVEPEDRDEARELIWDMSQEEYDVAMAAILEGSEVPKNK
jgi:hypothetical protein